MAAYSQHHVLDHVQPKSKKHRFDAISDKIIHIISYHLCIDLKKYIWFRWFQVSIT